MNHHLVFGSNSDKDKVYPGVVRYSIEHPEESIIAHFGSADNTPEKVDHIFNFLVSEETDVFMSGAGMSNVLTGVMKAKAEFDDLIIGIPISDSSTGGLSSLLSTSEKPPLNPVLTVGINNTYGALNIASRYGSYFGYNVALLSNKSRDFPVSHKSIDSVAEELHKLGVRFEISPLESITPDDVVITVFSHYNHINSREEPDKGYLSTQESKILSEVDKKLGAGIGIQIGVREKTLVKRFDRYMDCLDDTFATGIVNIGGYKNAAQMAGLLQGNAAALHKIRKEKEEKTLTLGKYASEIIKDGMRNKYGVFEKGRFVRY